MTTTQESTIQSVLNEADPNRLADGLRKAKVGDALQGLQKTLTGLTSQAAHDLTTIDDPDDTSVKLPAALIVQSARVTAGAAAAGPRHITDVGGTPGAPGANGPGIATISADGKTITFEAAVTAFVIYYVPKQDLTAAFDNE
jgi:hypothetical protein